MALTKNQLISRLARELYDLKFKRTHDGATKKTALLFLRHDHKTRVKTFSDSILCGKVQPRLTEK